MRCVWIVVVLDRKYMLQPAGSRFVGRFAFNTRANARSWIAKNVSEKGAKFALAQGPWKATYTN